LIYSSKKIIFVEYEEQFKMLELHTLGLFRFKNEPSFLERVKYIGGI